MSMSDSPSRELIDLYDSREAAGNIAEPLGWASKPVQWVVKIDKRGKVRRGEYVKDVQYINDVQCVRAVRYTLPEPLTSRSSGNAPLLAHDKMKYISEPKYWEAFRAKHLHFGDRLGLPNAFIKFLQRPAPPLQANSKVWKRMMADIADTKDVGAEGGWFVIELPDGSKVHDIAGVKSFWNCSNMLEWQNYGQKKQDCVKWDISSVSGEWGWMTPFHAAIGACVPGAKSGAKIGSINKNASSYYSCGREGAYCVPMTIEETVKLAASIKDLARYDSNGRSCVRLVSGRSQKFVIWKNKMEEAKTLVLAWGPEFAVSLFDLGEQTKSGDKALEVVRYLSGHRMGEKPNIKKGDQVHLLALSAKSGGRIAIEDSWYEEASVFAERMAKWYENTMMFNRNGVPTYMGVWDMVKALRLPKTKTIKHSEAECHAYRQIQSAIVNGDSRMPSFVRSRAVDAIPGFMADMKDRKNNRYIDDYDSPFRLLRACRRQEGVQYKEGRFEMETKSAAYRLGELVVKMDDAKYDFDKKRGNKTSGNAMGFSPTAQSIQRQCETNPHGGLLEIRKKLKDFSGWDLARTAGLEDTLPRHFDKTGKEEFWNGIAAGLEARMARMDKNRNNGAQKATKESNAAARTKKV